MKNIVYYSRMFQSVHHLAEIQKQTGGTFVTTRKSTFRAFRNRHPKLHAAKCSKIPVSSGNYVLNKADQVITGSLYTKTMKKLDAWKAMTFHGTYAWLTPAVVEKLATFDHLFLIGPRMKQMLERHLTTTPKFSYEVSGFLPFGSYSEKPTHSKDILFESKFTDPTLPLILYAPTSWKVGSFREWALHLATHIPANCNLLIRPHPRIALKGKRDPRALLQQLLILAKSTPNLALDLNEFEANKLYAHTNLVISDANSTAEESLFYDCPQLLIETEQWSRERLIEHARQDHIHPANTKQLATVFDLGPTLNVRNKDKTTDIISKTLSSTHQYKKNRAEYFHWVFGSKKIAAASNAAKTILENAPK